MDKAGFGFVLGKFMPPHQGHVFMCEFARQYCDKLVILVCSLPNEPIPGELRYKWMKELFPDCIVLHETRELPQEPNALGERDFDFWRVWGDVISDACRIGGSVDSHPDVLFASELYGERLAWEVGAEFVPVDISRTTRAVSGTAIRAKPFENWEYIPHVVRPHYVKRVTLFGPESTGKSTLARELGQHYDTIVCPEYGRTYTETFGTSITVDDLRRITAGHTASVAAAKRQANKVLIEDTDPVMTAVWSDMLLGARDPWFDSFSDYADLYLLTDIVDVPWEDDGTRYFQEDRLRFFRKCQAELEARGVSYIKISSSREERLATAVKAIDKLILDN